MGKGEGEGGRVMEDKKYQDFMWNPKNEYNCHECPENRRLGLLFPERLPCGQQNCWVVCHTKSKDGEE
jgi:hypothetical protein